MRLRRLSIFCIWLIIFATIYYFKQRQVISDSVSGKLLRDSFEHWEQITSSRLLKVRKICDNYRIRQGTNFANYRIVHPPAPQYSVFYFHPKKKLAYCPVYKAASTSMLHWLLGMAGVDEETIRQSGKQISDIARSRYPSMDYPAAEKLLQDSLRVMIVRHPFERILSAYRDKLEDSQTGREHGTLHYYQKYGRPIVAKYRRDNNNSKVEPTFDEFTDYLIHTDLSLYADDHWIPYYLFCTPCLVDYHVIAKFETLENDLKYIVHKLGTKEGPKVKHVTHGGHTSAKIGHYFRYFNREKLLKLYAKFQLDFELFDYNIDDYFSIISQ